MVESLPISESSSAAATTASSQQGSYPSVVTGLTVAVSLIAGAIQLVLILLASNRPYWRGLGQFAAFCGIMGYLVGPYVAMSVIAWFARPSRGARWAVLLALLPLIACGLWISGVHTYRFLTEEEYRKLQAILVFVFPLAQWLACGLLAAAVLAVRLLGPGKRV